MYSSHIQIVHSYSYSLHDNLNPRQWSRDRLFLPRPFLLEDMLDHVQSPTDPPSQSPTDPPTKSPPPSSQPSQNLLQYALEIVGQCASDQSCDKDALNIAVAWFVNDDNHPNDPDPGWDEQVWKVRKRICHHLMNVSSLQVILYLFNIMNSLKPITHECSFL